MIMAVTNKTKSGRFIPLAKALGVCLALPFLLSGCMTTSSEDDYVAAVLAEAMQDYGPVGEMPPVAKAEKPAEQTVSVQQPVAISIPAQTSVSVTPGGTVSVVPATFVSLPAEPVAVPVTPAVSVPATPAVSVPAGGTVAVVPSPAVVAQTTPTTESSAVAVPATPASVQTTTEGGGAPPVMEINLAPKAALPRPSVATIQPDSILWIAVTEDPSLSGRYVVNDSSAIDFGYVGLVFLPDFTVEHAEAEIKRILEGRYLKNATVSVKLAKASYDRVSVQGNVQMPGEIKIGPGAAIPLNEALRRAGGLRASRESSRVKIIRGGAKTPFGAAAEGDIYPLMSQNGQMKVPEIFLRNDDLAYVFTPSSEVRQGGDAAMTGMGGKRVILLGEVPRRGVIEFSENEPCTLMYLLFKIGGLPRFARGNKISVVRRDKNGNDKKFIMDGDKLMKDGRPEDDLVLETGDRIVVPARSISFL